MSINQETKTAQRCALIWFSISSDEVFEALTSANMEPMGGLGLRIDQEAFRDVSNLLREKREFRQGIEAARTLWRLQCSPPPCAFAKSSYESLLCNLEEGFGPNYTR